jgi:hypothetical protein
MIMFYRNVKVFYDGDNFIGILYKPSRFKRKSAKPQKPIRKIEVREIKEKIIEEETEEITTLKDEFEEVYKGTSWTNKQQQKAKITAKLNPYFKDKETLKNYVENNMLRKRKAFISRVVRFRRKAYLNSFNFFATFTYDDKLQTEESFQRRLLKCLHNLHTRNGWKYMGVWERGKKTGRLHFHAILSIPHGAIPGEYKAVKQYDTRKHRMVTTFQYDYFLMRFGRCDFQPIRAAYDVDGTISYLCKYIEKSGEKIVYSRGLPDHIRCDVSTDDVAFRFGEYQERLWLIKKFHCFIDGEDKGEVEEYLRKYIFTDHAPIAERMII